MKFLTQLILATVLCSSLHGAIVPYKKNVLTTNDLTLGATVSLSNGVLEATSGVILQSLYYGAQFGFGSGSIVPTNVAFSNLPAGTNDLFTVPTGYRFILNALTVGTTNQTTATLYPFLKTNGVYYRYSVNTTVITNGASTLAISGDNFLFEAGEGVAMWVSLIGCNGGLSGVLFPTNMPIYSPRMLSFTGGNDTFYTCPAGKCAINMQEINPSAASSPPLGPFYINDSGASRLLNFYLVPSGGSPDSSNLRFQRTVTTNTVFGFIANILFPGDSLVLKSSSSTGIQWVRMTVAEIPFP